MKMNMVRHKLKNHPVRREVQQLFLNEFGFVAILRSCIGVFVSDGLDFGVGIVSRFVGDNDQERRLYMNTLVTYWDANEVWLITAGGAMFAAFRHWYATMFSGFYIPLVFMVLALILRGVSFEFRGKVENQKWKNTWDWTL